MLIYRIGGRLRSADASLHGVVGGIPLINIEISNLIHLKQCKGQC